MRVDVAELELALINIAVNARDAMPNGGRFTVRAGNISFRHEDGFPIVGDFVQLSLEDTGAGMTSGRARPRVRAAFHDQAERHGHGARLAAGVRVLRALGRPCRDRQRDRRGHVGAALSAARRGRDRGRAGRAGTTPAESGRAARACACCWSRTTTKSPPAPKRCCR